MKLERAMNRSRRGFLQFAGSAAMLSVIPRIARAQAYPLQPVRIVVGFAAGGPNDVLARLIGQRLSDRLGKPFVIENRPGAGGNIGTEAVVRSPADGYTLLLVGPTNMVNATLYDKLSFNFMRDISPVAGLIRVPQILAVNPTVPAKSVAEFIAYAKSNPGKINMGSPGNGTPAHISGELFNMMAAVNLVHVPYRGAAPVVTDLLSGHVQVYFGALPSSIGYIKEGKLRGLAVTSARRSEALPDVPTLSEFVPGYEASSVFGICAPRNTPVEIVEKLNQEVNAAFDDPKMQAGLASLGGIPLPGSPADFTRLIADETDKWGRVIKSANIKLS